MTSTIINPSNAGISGLGLWLDAAYSPSITSIPSSWSDRSGLGCNATGSGTLTGVTMSNINGVPAIYIPQNSGYYDWTANTPTSTTTGYTMFFVGTQTPINTQVRVFTTTGGTQVYSDPWTVWVNFANPPGSITATSPYIFSCSVGSTFQFWNNGTSNGSPANTNAYSSSSVMIANNAYNGANSAYQYYGLIGEVIVYNSGMLSTSNRQIIEGYLAWKWGAQSNLAAGHPYYTAAPVFVGTPTNLILITSGGSATLSWTAAAGATGYSWNLYQSSSNNYVGTSFATGTTLGATTASATGLTLGLYYYFTVIATATGGSSPAAASAIDHLQNHTSKCSV